MAAAAARSFAEAALHRRYPAAAAAAAAAGAVAVAVAAAAAVAAARWWRVASLASCLQLDRGAEAAAETQLVAAQVARATKVWGVAERGVGGPAGCERCSDSRSHLRPLRPPHHYRHRRHPERPRQRPKLAGTVAERPRQRPKLAGTVAEGVAVEAAAEEEVVAARRAHNTKGSLLQVEPWCPRRCPSSRAPVEKDLAAAAQTAGRARRRAAA